MVVRAMFFSPSRRQGRFKSLLVDEDEYLMPLSRYIHLNPIRTSRFKDADFPTKSEYLKNYAWSSFPGYCYLRKLIGHLLIAPKCQ